MGDGNGADIGTVIAMLSQVLQVQQEHGRLLGEHGRILGEHGRKLDNLEGEMRGLRRTVTEYHASVVGHGILISELEARVRRIEDRLRLPPAA